MVDLRRVASAAAMIGMAMGSMGGAEILPRDHGYTRRTFGSKRKASPRNVAGSKLARRVARGHRMRGY